MQCSRSGSPPCAKCWPGEIYRRNTSKDKQCNSVCSTCTYCVVQCKNGILVATLLCLVNMSAQLPLLLSQRCLLFPFDRITGKNHHNRLIPCLLPVSRTARSGLILLALHGSELLASFSTFLNGGNTLGVVCFRLLARAQDVHF